MRFRLAAPAISAYFVAFLPTAHATPIDLSKARVVIASAEAGTASTVLIEEVEKRTGIRLSVHNGGASFNGPIVQIRTVSSSSLPAEGFSLSSDGGRATVTIEGAGTRGAIYGVGYFLRHAALAKGRIAIADTLRVRSSPRYPLRGHQLGYRNTANSWDAWTVAQYDQYIRELALFGVNAIENIPFQDDRKTPLMKVPRREMNRAMADICRRYGLDYWVWTPATVDLRDAAARAQLLARFDELFADVPDLAGIFVPGGDPGNNPPDLLLPFLEELGHRSSRPATAKVWVSMQGFHGEKEEAVYRWAGAGGRDMQSWFGGIVAGPSSPPAAATRRRLPAWMGLRLYPDLTHNKLSQFEVPQWDQAYARTLGREAINPRPHEYAAIFRKIAPASLGFISYSDGVHDDVNKIIWSALAWDPDQDIRRILIEYSRLFFGDDVAEEAADGILALENNWRGSLASNGGVEAALQYWEALDKRSANGSNWRWQMCLLRANYDAYVRRRLLFEQSLEAEANRVLSHAGAELSAEAAIGAALEALQRPAGNTITSLRVRIVDLGERLFQSIRLQTSVEKYNASDAQRGAVLDFLDTPLNNRWWLEDELEKVRKLSATEAAKNAPLHAIATWESPGPGSFYDAVGDLNKSSNAAPSPGGILGGATEDEDADPLFWWWESGRSRARLTWQVTRWPASIHYEGLDPKAEYVVRTQGYGQCLLRADGERVQPTVNGREMHEHKEFPVPPAALADGTLVLTFDRPTDEDHLNWRQKSRLAEVWLLKRKVH